MFECLILLVGGGRGGFEVKGSAGRVGDSVKRERVRNRQKENEIVKKDRKRIIFLSL